MTKKKLSTLLALLTTSAAMLVSSAVMFNQSKTASADTGSVSVSESMSGARIAYGPGWGAEAAAEVGEAFGDKLTELSVTDHGNVEVYNNAGDGDAVVFGMSYGSDYLMYNVFNKEVYAVKGDFAYLRNEVRRIGAPVTDQITGVTVTGWDGESHEVNVSDATVQVFETGIGIVENGSVVKHEGVIEKISDTEYKIHPLLQDQDVLAKNAKGGNKATINGESYNFIGDVDGTWHALRTARTFRDADKLAVEYNFRAGCLEVVYNADETISSRMAYAGQNFDYETDGTAKGRVTLPRENFTTDEHLWENHEDGVESNALSMYRNLSGNQDATKDTVKEAFRTGYTEMLDAGVIPGYRCSWIKVWDVLCVDYKYSPDSRYGFDGAGSAARERMFTLVYSGVQDKVYGVGDDFWLKWKEDDTRRALGAPISNAMENKIVSGIKFNRIQIFEQGYIYENDNGVLVTEYGTTTDGNYENFIFRAAPDKKPDKYGTEIERFETTENGRKVVYINYQRGAVKATETHAKLGYVYDYCPGRNFKLQKGVYKTELLPYEKLYSDSDFRCDGIYNDIFNDGSNGTAGVKTQIINKIKELLDDGFFIGFVEDKFKAWNDTGAQQFIFGDSTAQPWSGDVRTNVSALLYNEMEGEVFLLKDAFMEIWGGAEGAWKTLGAPAGDEFKLEGNENLTFQYFYGSATRNNKAFAASVGYNEATYYAPNDDLAATVNPEQYIKDVKELSTPLSGIKIAQPADTNVEVDGFVQLEYEITGAKADAEIKLTSSDESIARVMEDGSVEFYKAGTVTITVTVTDGVNTFSDRVTFTVHDAAAKSVAAVGSLGADTPVSGTPAAVDGKTIGGAVGGTVAFLAVAGALVAVVYTVNKKRKAV